MLNKSNTHSWIGRSGRSYIYHIHQLPVNFNQRQDGNYIFCKQDFAGRWVPVYIGQGDLGERISPDHHQARCITIKGATHVHVHLNSDKVNRLTEEQDLLTQHRQAHAPHGCNIAING